MTESVQSSSTDHVLSLTLTPHTTIHIRIQSLSRTLLVHLTSTSHASSGGGSSSLGSFVYALPNRLEPSNPLSTPLVTVPNSIDLATRTAKILAKRTSKPVYVSCSVDLAWGPGGAGMPEVGEEVEVLRKVVELVTREVADANGVNGVNGVSA